jgi:cysteinyl-tRNA synthetase
MKAMRDDFNTPMALAQLLNAAKTVNGWADHCGEPEGCDDATILHHAYVILKEMLSLLGLYGKHRLTAGSALGRIEKFIEERIAERDDARKTKDYAKADAIRDEMKALGVEIKDSATGSTWSWAKSG